MVGIKIIFLAVLATLAIVNVEARSWKDLLEDIAKSSSSGLNKDIGEREKSIQILIKTTTPETLKKYYDEAKSIGEQLQKGITKMIYEHDQHNIFAGFSKNAVALWLQNGPSQFDPEIKTLIQWVEATLTANQKIDPHTVHCSTQNFITKHLTNIIYILRTNIKYLLTEDVALLNAAIIQKLKDDKFVAQTDFYQNHSFNEEQFPLLFQTYQQNQAINRESVGDALDHIAQPSDMIVGKLLESCSAVLHYSSAIETMKREIANCELNRQSIFGGTTMSRDLVEDTLNFCEQLHEKQKIDS